MRHRAGEARGTEGERSEPRTTPFPPAKSGDSLANPPPSGTKTYKIRENAYNVGMARHYKTNTSWRDQYNPLRGLSLAGIVGMEEKAETGDIADLQWFWEYMLKTDVTVKAAVAKRLAGMKSLDWEIRTVENADQGLAKAQADLLRSAYDRVENLVDAAGHLAMAKFTGLAMLEKIRLDNTPLVARFEYIPPWYFGRERDTGYWRFNPDANGGTGGEPVTCDSVIYATDDQPLFRPIGRSFFAKQLAMSDWDLALENGANQAVFFVMPEGTTEKQQDSYQAMAENLASNMRGALPYGTDVKITDLAARSKLPFCDRIKYCDEQIVMAATGGLLTMLTESGSGTLAGGAHKAGLLDLYKSDAAVVSEIFQRQMDVPILNEYFPNAPKVAYFRFDIPKEAESLKDMMEVVSTLSWVGLRIPPAVLSEKIGFMLEPIPGKE